MKKTFCILLVLLSATVLSAQTPRQLMDRGNEAYKRGDFGKAAECYNAVLASGVESAALYYNLGNACYRLDEMGAAILNYERALRMEPGFRDARQNLELANSKTEDHIAPLPEFFLSAWGRAVVGWLSPRGWRLVVLAVLLSLGAAVAGFFLLRAYAARKRSLFAAAALAALLLLSIGCAIASSARHNRHSSAIITQPMVVVKSSPEVSSIDKFILHEGSKVEITETLGNWYRITIADGNKGWLPVDEATVI